MLPQWQISIPLGAVLACPFVVHTCERRGRRELLATGGLAAVFWAAAQFLNGDPTVVTRCAGAAASLGLASLLILFVLACTSRGEKHRTILRTFFAGALFPCCWVGIGYALRWTVRYRPVVDDHLLYAFDGTLGFQLSFVLGRILQVHRFWLHLMIVIYEATVIPAAILYGAHRVQPKTGIRLIPLWASAIFVGYLVYGLFPAIGPVYAFPGFPWHAVTWSGPAEPIWSASAAPRNCMPSIHLTLALLIWWNSRGRTWWARLLAAIFVLATVIATLGLGEHYLADLVVAVPFALSFQAMWTTSVPLARRERFGTALAALTLCCAWLLFLRFAPPFFLPPPAFSWIAISATLLLCAGLNYRLNHAQAPQRAVELLEMAPPAPVS